MKLMERFYQVGGPGLSHPHDATAYLLQGEKASYLIDCGTPDGFEQVVINIRSLGIDPRGIEAIYGTHGHYDHVGAASLFRQAFGCRLHLNREDIHGVAAGDGVLTTASLLYNKRFPPCPVDGELEEGTLLSEPAFSLECLHTPGHTPGSVCFVLSAGGSSVLIAGDTLHGGFSPLIGSSEAAWRDSLQMLCARHFDFLVFGHQPASLLADADRRLDCLLRSYGVYYMPWFKNFYESFPY